MSGRGGAEARMPPENLGPGDYGVIPHSKAAAAVAEQLVMQVIGRGWQIR